MLKMLKKIVKPLPQKSAKNVNDKCLLFRQASNTASCCEYKLFSLTPSFCAAYTCHLLIESNLTARTTKIK